MLMLLNLASSTPPVTTQIVQGDVYLFGFSFPNYLNADWQGQLVFSRSGSQLSTIAATVDVDDPNGFDVFLDSAASVLITPGAASVFFIMTGKGEPEQRSSLFLGTLSVIPNPTGIYTPSSPAQSMLLAVNATITKILSQPEQSASFNGQSYTLHNVKELYSIRNELLTQVGGELRSLGIVTKPTARIIQNRFV